MKMKRAHIFLKNDKVEVQVRSKPSASFISLAIIIGLACGQIIPMAQPISYPTIAQQISFQKPSAITTLIEAPEQAYPVMQKINRTFVELAKTQSVPLALSQFASRTEYPVVLIVAGEGMAFACSVYQSASPIPSEFIGQIMAAQKINALPIANSVISGVGFGMGAVGAQQLIQRSSHKLATATLLGITSGIGFYATISTDLALLDPRLQETIPAIQSTLMGVGLIALQSLPSIITDFLKTSQKQKNVTPIVQKGVALSSKGYIKDKASRVKATISQVTTALGKVTLVAVAVGTTAYALSQDEQNFISTETKEAFANTLGTTLGLIGSTVAYEYAYRVASQATTVASEYAASAIESGCQWVHSTGAGSSSWNKCKDFVQSFNPFRVPAMVK